MADRRVPNNIPEVFTKLDPVSLPPLYSGESALLDLIESTHHGENVQKLLSVKVQ